MAGFEAPAQIYKKTGNLRAVQLLLGHTKLESTCFSTQSTSL
jgi:site-specific recombinase XerC